MDKYKLASVLFRILLLHKGPISELCIRIDDTGIINEIVNEIDLIIIYLSWSKSIKKFVFDVPLDECYKLPGAFFLLQGFEDVTVRHCEIVLPITFTGFSMLKILVLLDVNPVVLEC